MRIRFHPHLITAGLALTGMSFIAATSGCEREIAHTEQTEIEDDGTVRTEEKTVTEGPGNKTTVTETETTREPDDQD